MTNNDKSQHIYYVITEKTKDNNTKLEELFRFCRKSRSLIVVNKVIFRGV